MALLENLDNLTKANGLAYFPGLCLTSAKKGGHNCPPAVDKNGDIVVDTFKLPSACVCNYRGKTDLLLRNGFAVVGDQFQKTFYGRNLRLFVIS